MDTPSLDSFFFVWRTNRRCETWINFWKDELSITFHCKNPAITSWGWQLLLLFTVFFTSQVVVRDFFHHMVSLTIRQKQTCERLIFFNGFFPLNTIVEIPYCTSLYPQYCECINAVISISTEHKRWWYWDMDGMTISFFRLPVYK